LENKYQFAMKEYELCEENMNFYKLQQELSAQNDDRGKENILRKMKNQ
jgi:hypothetical protein